MTRFNFHSAWSAICWMIKHRLQGGRQVSIPTILPDPTFSKKKPGFRPYHGDEVEEPYIELGIKKALEDAIDGNFLCEEDIKNIFRGAHAFVTWQLDWQSYQAGVSKYEAGMLAEMPKMPKTPSKKQRKQTDRAVHLSRKLTYPFETWGVINA